MLRSLLILCSLIVLSACGEDSSRKAVTPSPAAESGKPGKPAPPRGPSHSEALADRIEGTIAWRADDRGEWRKLTVKDRLVSGAEITLSGGAALTLRFSAGMTLEVVGPASLRLKLLVEYARTISLEEGTIARLVVGEVTTGLETEGSFVALKNGSVALTVEQGQATYRCLSGEEAKLVVHGKVEPFPAGATRTVE